MLKFKACILIDEETEKSYPLNNNPLGNTTCTYRTALMKCFKIENPMARILCASIQITSSFYGTTLKWYEFLPVTMPNEILRQNLIENSVITLCFLRVKYLIRFSKQFHSQIEVYQKCETERVDEITSTKKNSARNQNLCTRYYLISMIHKKRCKTTGKYAPCIWFQIQECVV